MIAVDPSAPLLAPGSHHAWPLGHRHRHRALRLRRDADGPCDPLRALSRGRRLPRRHRLPDRSRCGPTSSPASACSSLRSTGSPTCSMLSELGAACAMALMLYLTWHRSRSPFGLPFILIGGVIAAHAGVLDRRDLARQRRRRRAGPFSRRRTSTFMLPWSSDEIGRYPWYAVPDLLGNLIAVIFVTATSTLFNTTGIEVAVASRSQSGTGAERHRHRQHPVGRARRLHRLHFVQPLHAQFQRRRHRPAFRPDRRRGLRR